MNKQRFLILDAYPPPPATYPICRDLIALGHEAVNAGPQTASFIREEEFRSFVPEYQHHFIAPDESILRVIDEIGWVPDGVIHLSGSWPRDLDRCPAPTLLMHIHHQRFASSSERHLCYYDRVLMLLGSAPVYAARGYDHVVAGELKWFPPWHLPHFEPRERTIDVSFVGRLHPPASKEHRFRSCLMARILQLVREGTQVFIQGSGVGYLTVQGIYASSRIVLDYGTEGRHLTSRGLEALWSGAMLLIPKPGIGERNPWHDSFEDRRNVVYFESIGDAVELIRHYLSHERERDEIAHAGQQLARDAVLDWKNDLGALILNAFHHVPPDFLRQRTERLARFGVDNRRRTLDIALDTWENTKDAKRAIELYEAIPGWEDDLYLRRCHATAEFSHDDHAYSRDINIILDKMPDDPFALFTLAIAAFNRHTLIGVENVINVNRMAIQAIDRADPAQIDPNEVIGPYITLSNMSRFQLELDEICYALPPGADRSGRALQLCSFQLHRNLGYVFLGLRDWGLAHQALRIAEQIFPDDALTLAYIGRCLSGLGRTTDAISSYRRAIALEPFMTEAVIDL
ncbi:MAG: glycosyltransferase, partial [Candidatus Poribacteria bacterium]|nr:glycosyltransferase [Candidatus Poribacteria bacterium]